MRIALLSASLFFPLLAHTPSPDEQAVLAPIQSMFSAMARHDAAAFQQPLLPGGSVVLMRQGKPVQMTFAAFAQHVGEPGRNRIEERIHDPVIHIDRDLAVVWAPFDFLVDGKVDHCGTDLFTLVRPVRDGTQGSWLIASIADTGRRLCPAQ